MYPLLYVFCNTAFVETLERIRREILPIITNEAADYFRDQLARNTKISVKESTLEYTRGSGLVQTVTLNKICIYLSKQIRFGIRRNIRPQYFSYNTCLVE